MRNSFDASITLSVIEKYIALVFLAGSLYNFKIVAIILHKKPTFLVYVKKRYQARLIYISLIYGIRIVVNMKGALLAADR